MLVYFANFSESQIQLNDHLSLDEDAISGCIFSNISDAINYGKDYRERYASHTSNFFVVGAEVDDRYIAEAVTSGMIGNTSRELPALVKELIQIYK